MTSIRPRQELSRKEFLQRLELSPLRRRLGIPVTDRRYRQWVDWGIALSALRRGNEGRRPRYIFTSDHYRRALIIVGLYARNIKDTDAIVAHLFLNGEINASDALVNSLEKEALKAFRKIRSRIRATLPESGKNSGPKRKAKILEQIGPLDQRFGKLQLSEDDRIGLARIAIQHAEGQERFVPHLGAGTIWQDLLSCFALEIGNFFPGLLWFPDRDDPLQEERRLRSFGPRAYESARSVYQTFRLLVRTFDTVTTDSLVCPLKSGPP